MEKYIVEPTKDSPSIILDKDNYQLKITGKSYPEDAFEIYSPIIEWLDTIEGNISQEIVFEFDFEFISSTTHKMVCEMLLKMNEFIRYGNAVNITWNYNSDDEDIKETGEELISLLKIPMKIIMH